MHVPDHVFTAPTVIATAAVSVGVVACAAWRSRRTLDRNQLLMGAGVTGFVFTGQLVNYPVSAGTSGHIIGAALALMLLGPWLAIISMSVVLTVQALVFADGGIAALGVNVLLMAIVPVALSWAVASAVRGRKASAARLTASGAVAGALSVPAAAGAFAALYWAGGVTSAPAGEVLAAMVSVHLVIGAGEAALTAVVVALVATRAPGAMWADNRRIASTHLPRRVGIAATGAGVVLAVVAKFASSAPDGLESVALRFGFSSGPTLSWNPLADYGEGSGVPVAIAALVGGAACFAVFSLLMRHSSHPFDTPRRS